MNSRKARRLLFATASLVLSVVLTYFVGALSVWKGRLAEIVYPAEEFGQRIIYPSGFWFHGAILFLAVSVTSALLANVVRNLVITVDGYENPAGSLQLRIWGYSITGLGVGSSFLNSSLGPLVFMVGLACLVVSIQQKPASQSALHT